MAFRLPPAHADKTYATGDSGGKSARPIEPPTVRVRQVLSDNQLGRLTGLDIAGVSQSEIPGRSGHRLERRQSGRAEAGRQGLQGRGVRQRSRCRPTASSTARSSTAASVAEAIRRLFDGRGIKTKDVAASLSGNAVIVKKITLPVMTESELAESIYWEAEQYIPFDIQDVNLDYQILDRRRRRRQGDDGRPAGRGEEGKDRRLYRRDCPGRARSAVVVDVDAFALQNAYEINYGIEPGAVVVLLNAGASATNINILNGDQSVFTRDISIGGNAYTEALQKELNLPFDLADQLKRGMAVDGVTFEDARPVLRAVSENVMLEIQKTFDFFKATASSDRHRPHHAQRRSVARGGLHRDARRDRFEAPVEALDPFKRVELRREEVPGGVGGRRRADGGGRGRPRAAPGGRPMIRINLLAVDRERTKRGALIPAAQRVTIAASLILIWHGARRRLVVLVAAPGVDPGRRGPREGRARDAAAAFGARAGAEVRSAARRSSSSASR